jgi:hypothetical protein
MSDEIKDSEDKSEGSSSVAAGEFRLDEEAAPPKPKVPKKGVYVLEEGDTPASVSTKLFGRGQFAVAIVRANPNVEWVAGSVIDVP